MLRLCDWRPGPFRATAALVLACYMAACTAWHTQSATPQQVVAKQPKNIRIVRQDGSTIQMYQPLINGDTVEGLKEAPRGDRLTQRVAVALVDVKSVQVESPDAGLTILAGAAGVVLVVGMIAALSNLNFNWGSGSSSRDTSPIVPSCPYVYSWDGNQWRLESGTFAGAVARGVARTDVSLLAHAAAEGPVLRLQVRTDLNETDFIDAMSVLAVDHAPGVAVAPGSDGSLHGLGTLIPATEARDDAGRDVAALLAAQDDRSWESRVAPRDTADPRALRDGIELVFPRPPGARAGLLVVDAGNTSWAAFMLGWIVSMHGRVTRAWYDSLATYPEAARHYRELLVREATLRVLVRDGERWVPQGFVIDPGARVTRRQVVSLDLSNISGASVRVRLESAPSLWLIDHVAIDYGPEPSLLVHDVAPVYARTTEGSDVLPLIRRMDGQEWMFQHATRADTRFALPPLESGKERSFLVKTSGWYRLRLPENAEPDIAALTRIFRDPDNAARISVTAMNEALRAGSQQPGP